jgi:hypothetical protein
MSAKRKPKEAPQPAAPLRLDLGCGKNPRQGFTGVDARDFGQPIKFDLCGLKKGVPRWELIMPPGDGTDIFEPWPWADGSVEEIHCSHFLEHLTRRQRIHFVNEMYRVLKLEGKAQVIVPHWNSPRAYGDMTHDPMPVCEFFFQYVNRGWREVNAPHSDYAPEVNFEVNYGYGLRQDIALRDQNYQNYAMANYKDAIQDIHSLWTKKA